MFKQGNKKIRAIFIYDNFGSVWLKVAREQMKILCNFAKHSFQLFSIYFKLPMDSGSEQYSNKSKYL